MFGMKNDSNELTDDLSKLLKEEGRFVKELTDVATKAAEFHARLEAIEKALGSNPATYSSNEADKFVQQANDKYSSELENKMKEEATDTLKTF